MKLFSKSFFLSLLAIMLFSTGSAMALNVTLQTDCDATGTGNCASMTCVSNVIQNLVSLTAPQGVSATLSYTSTCTGTDANPAIVNCKSACEAIKNAIRLAAYKAKLDPMADAKYDTQDQTFSRAMCQALKVVTGSAGKTFAAFAIIATGIGFFTGKVSWGLMIGVTAGIATMFGAPSIVAAISGQDTTMNCDKIMPN